MSLFGPGMTGVFAMLFEWVRLGKNVYFLGWGRNRVQMVSAWDVADACLLDLLNNPTPLGIVPPSTGIPDPSPAQALGSVLAGSNIGNVVANALLSGDPTALNLTPPRIVTQLSRDPRDGPPSGFGVPEPLGSIIGLPLGGLSMFLSDEQEALLGCGPFYRTDCDDDGIDRLVLEGVAHVLDRLGLALVLLGQCLQGGGDEAQVRVADVRDLDVVEGGEGAQQLRPADAGAEDGDGDLLVGLFAGGAGGQRGECE